MNEPLEIEVKYLITDIPDVRRRIIEARGVSQGRFFETNIRFEDAVNGLKNQRKLLRLRRDQRNTLTFKCEVDDNDTRYKILKELEVEVDCFQTMRAILAALGFKEAQVYEKWRETFHIGNAVICIDEMPYADFMEIEGDPADIDSLSNHLGFGPSQAITANYLEIFACIKRLENLDFDDVTFDHFKMCHVSRKTLIGHARAFEAETTSPSARFP